jgi:hypothetical protein
MVMLVGKPDLVSAFARVKGLALVEPACLRVSETPAVARELEGDTPCFELDPASIRRLANKGDELAIRLMPTVCRLDLEQGGQLRLF